MNDKKRGVLSDAQRFQWLKLFRTPNVGPVTFRDLINRFGSAALALEALPEMAARGGAKRAIVAPDDGIIEREFLLAERMGARFVAIGEPDYPSSLRQSEFAPPLIAMVGHADVFTKPAIAIVGSRNASAVGLKITQTIATHLGMEGYAIISGLARGIDRMAHEASLKTGTVGVLAGGLDMPYPPQNLDLYSAIPDNGGAIISNMPFGFKARAQDFPRRNALIAALGYGTLVVEAATRSGSLVTARYANEIGRHVYAVPGSPLDPRAEGTNHLIRNGAILVTSAEDIIEQISGLTKPPDYGQNLFSEPESLMGETPTDLVLDEMIELLGPAPTDIDDLIRLSGHSPHQVHSALLELELANRLERLSGGRVSLIE